MNPYRRRLWDLFRELMGPRGPFPTALDFGSGDGWFAEQMTAAGLVGDLTAVDVKLRPNARACPRVYDGVRLPYSDRAFGLVYAVDVFHHCPEPLANLRDALRCCDRYFLLKDHTYRTVAGWATLAALDEIGNRRFGIPSEYAYQRGWGWVPAIEAAGFRPVTLLHPVQCHGGLLGRMTNALQFIGLWERGERP